MLRKVLMFRALSPSGRAKNIFNNLRRAILCFWESVVELF